MLAHLHEPPPRAEGVSPELNRVLHRALAKDPEDRYPSAGDFGRAALAATEGRSVTEEERSVARGAAAPTIQREAPVWSGPVAGEAPVEELPPVKTYRARKRPRWLLLPVAGGLTAVAVAVAVIPGGGDEVPPPGSPVSNSEVERLAERFAKAYATEDAAAIRLMITSDAERVMPNERQGGRDDVTAAYQGQFDRSTITQFDLSDQEVTDGPVGRLTARYVSGAVTGRITFNVIRERTRARIKLISAVPDP
jgi:serine/threonine-protein kinase